MKIVGLVNSWAQNLSDRDREAMLVRAADSHPDITFTNSQEIGKAWARNLKEHGVGSLGSYARDEVMRQFVNHLNQAKAGTHESVA